MDRRLLRDALAWGTGLWLVGYLLGIVLFFALPPQLIGWAILPIGFGVTAWVLVRGFSPADGYYKPDVYLYYALTLTMPIAVGSWKARRVSR